MPNTWKNTAKNPHGNFNKFERLNRLKPPERAIRADMQISVFLFFKYRKQKMNKILNFITKKSAQYMPEIMEAQAKSNTIMAKNSVQAAMHGLAAVAMLGAAPLASAAGFEADAKDMANKIYKGIYGFGGVVALIVVLWQCVEGWSGRKSWMDILATCLWVVAAAASAALVTWLWQKGQSMTFG